MRARAQRPAVELLGGEPALVDDGAAFFGQASRGKLPAARWVRGLDRGLAALA